MREYLYRGVRVDNGEWIEGGIYHQKADEVKGEAVYIIGGSLNDVGCAYQVIPETVSEYIGIHDKNGKKIFENDIVLTQEMYNRPYSKNRKSKRHIGVVQYQSGGGSGFYNSETGKFDKYIEYHAEWIVKVKDYGVYTHGSWSDFWNCEVIGNVFDYPEWLEAAEDIFDKPICLTMTSEEVNEVVERCRNRMAEEFGVSNLID